MAYTNTWDETKPPDTDVAKTYGSVLRNNERLDVRQRVASFGAGTLAMRPTPESVFSGVTYYATDTNQYFLWNGTSWVLTPSASGTGQRLQSYNSTKVLTNASGVTVGASIELQAPDLTSIQQSSLLSVRGNFSDTSGFQTQIGFAVGQDSLHPSAQLVSSYQLTRDPISFKGTILFGPNGTSVNNQLCTVRTMDTGYIADVFTILSTIVVANGFAFMITFSPLTPPLSFNVTAFIEAKLLF